MFSQSDNDLGRTDIISHHIETADAKPVRQSLRRFPPAHVELISKHVDNMLIYHRTSMLPMGIQRGISEEKGWLLTLLYRLSSVERRNS